MTGDQWVAGDAYEAYIGRWSRPVASGFVRRLNVGPGRRWLDVGCGTGALTGTILATAGPAEVIGVDPSEGFLALARNRCPDAVFHVGDARALPVPDAHVDVVVSGLALNFVPDPAAALAEFTRVTRPGGVVAAYVWDYADGMRMLRAFWDAATTVDPSAIELDEGRRRFPLCQPEPLERLWVGGGLDQVTVEAITVPTVFVDFDDYWNPFLGGQGPAPSYVSSLAPDQLSALRELLRDRLPTSPDGSIQLSARAWAIRGHRNPG